jgi:hypothetical protein
MVIAWRDLCNPQDCHTDFIGPFRILFCDWHFPEVAVWLDCKGVIRDYREEFTAYIEQNLSSISGIQTRVSIVTVGMTNQPEFTNKSWQ